MWNQTLQWMWFSELWFVSRALRDSKFQRRNGPLVNALQILQTVILVRGQSSRLVMVLYTKVTAEYEWPVSVYNQTCPSLVWGPVNMCIHKRMCVNNKWLWAHHLCKLPQSSPQESYLQAEALYLLWERASPGPIVRLHNSAAKTSERVDSCVTATANTLW